MLWNEPVTTLLHDKSVGNLTETVNLQGKYTSLTAQILGAAAGATPTITFSASLDGVNWIEIAGVDVKLGTAVTASTTDRLLMFPVSNVKFFRAVISNFSGTDEDHAVTVTAVYSVAPVVQLTV